MSRLPRLPAAVRWTVPALLLAATGVSLGRAASSPQQYDLLFKPAIGPVVKVERTKPLRVLPLYNEPGLVSDAELGRSWRRCAPVSTVRDCGRTTSNTRSVRGASTPNSAIPK